MRALCVCVCVCVCACACVCDVYVCIHAIADSAKTRLQRQDVYPVGGPAHRTAVGVLMHMLRTEVEAGQNDARWLRQRQSEEQLLAEVSRQAAQRFRGAAA